MKAYDRKRSIPYILSLAHFVNDNYSLMLAPLLMFLKPAFGMSYSMAGLFVSLPLMISAVLQTPVSYWAEKRGAGRQVLALGFLVLALSFGSLGVAGSYAILLALSVLVGLGLSTYHPQAISLISHLFGREKGRYIGIHGIGGSLSTLTAPLFIAFTCSFLGWRLGVAALAVPGVLFAMALYLVLKESPPKVEHKNLRASITKEAVKFAVISSLLVVFTRGYTAFIPLLFLNITGNVATAGVMTTVVLLPAVLAQYAGGYASERYSRKGIIITVFLLAGLLLLGVVLTSGWVRILAMLLLSFTIFFATPVKFSYASDLGSGVAVSVALLFGTGMAIASLSPILIGALIDMADFNTAFASLVLFALAGAFMMRDMPDFDRGSHKGGQ